jgi:signal transduction histidine kinase/CheY-like chemotaxis protein
MIVMDMTVVSPKAARLPFRVRALFGGFVVLVAVIAAAGWFINLQASNTYWARHTLEVQNSVSRAFSLLQDAETGQRGYLLTGDLAYLAPFSQADAEIDAELEKLGRLVEDNSFQKQAVSELGSIVDAKRAELRRTIELRRSGDPEAALATVRGDAGKELMDRAREVVARMRTAEETLLASRIEQGERSLYALQAAIVVAGSIALLLAISSIYYVRRYLLELRAAYDHLAIANNTLTQEATERDRLEGQLRQSQKMEIIGQLAGGIAHDFNNMLAVVIGNLNLLQRRMASGQSNNLARFVDGAMEGANRAAALTSRLLAFSRQQPLAPAAIDVNKLVSGMTDLLRGSLGEAVILETVLAGGLWRTFVDAAQLESVVMNIAVNARDAMPEGGRLTIETVNSHLDEAYATAHQEVKAGQYVLIAISDTGTGMSAATIAKAFDPFFTTKPTHKGTGLGLSQVYGFVKQSGGHVKIYSELGRGTSFKVYLPRFVGAMSQTEELPREATVHSGNPSEIVLVVDDDDRVRRLTVDALRDLNYTVLHANGATTALRVLDSNPDVNLLLTDVVMPEVNGRQLAEEAQRRVAELKVLYFTGYTRNAIVHNGTLDRGVHLMSKPFTLEQLASKVREALSS